MDNNQRRNFFLEALLKQSQPEPEPKPKSEWAKLLFAQGTIPVAPRPNPLSRVSLKPPPATDEFHVTEEIKLGVWQKARTVSGSNPAWVRMDSQGTLMFFDDYGKCESILGWQVDHIIPRSKGGSDLLSNLQALNWKNNLRKGDKVPPFRSPLSL